MKAYWDLYFYFFRGCYPFYLHCPEKYHDEYRAKEFEIRNGYKPDFENPKTLSEKIWWLLKNEKIAEKTRLADKAEAKEWAKQLIGEEHITKTFGVWERVEDIDFNSLPEKFVIKATHGCRMNITVTNKKVFLENYLEKTKKCADKWLKTNYYYYHGELQYKGIKPRILAEEYTENKDNKKRTDFQIHCFNGEPLYIEHNHFENGTCDCLFYDTDCKKTDFYIAKEKKEIELKKPDNLELMLNMARKLSKDFKYARVDLRDCKDRIVFGEITFSPMAGVLCFTPREYNLKLGEKIIL